MWFLFVISVFWLLVSAMLVAQYRRVSSPLPEFITMMLVVGTLCIGFLWLAAGISLWVRIPAAAFWVLAAVGLIVVHRRLNKAAHERQKAKPPGRPEVNPRNQAELVKRLQSLGFTTTENIQYNGQSLAIAARRVRFELGMGRLTEDFFIVGKFDRLDSAILKEYSRICFKYAVRHGKVPLPWGMQTIHFAMCHSVAMVSGVDDALASSIAKTPPPWHWSGCEFPVVWDTATGRLCYSEVTDTVGVRNVSWDLLRLNTLEALAPVAQESQ